MTFKTLADIYDAVPTIACQGKCTGACGPIGFFGLEADNLEANGVPLPEYHTSTLACTALNRDGRCSIYEQRPLVCRLFGVVKQMRCQWGCEPSRILTEAEEKQLLTAAIVLSEGRSFISEPRKSVLEL